MTSTPTPQNQADHVPSDGVETACITARDADPARKGDWMQTFTGRRFWPLDPRPADVSIEDIAHALSLLCRYGGHCTRFYSVAEHCVLLARAASPENRLWLLLHDASEAYLSDMVRPLKRHMPEYRAAEDRVAWAVYEAFRLDPGMEPTEVKTLDNRILMDERAQLMAPTGDTWNYGGAREPLDVTLQFWSPERAEREFLSLYSEITGWSAAMPATALSSSAAAGSAGWKPVPEKIADEMIQAARRAKINGTNMRASDWIEGASQQDLSDIGGVWPQSPWDRGSEVEEQVHEILFTTWWKAMLDAAPTAPTPTKASRIETVRGEEHTDEIRYKAERGQFWLEEAQRLALLVRALGGNPEPGAPPLTIRPVREGALRDALDNSQSLLAMILHLGASQDDWQGEEVPRLLTEQIIQNRAALTARPVGEDALREALELTDKYLCTACECFRSGPGSWHLMRARSVVKAALANPTQPAAGQGAGVIAEIEDERRRQVEAEGWTPEHDDLHAKGEMCDAAAAYASHAGRQFRPKGTPPACWPWQEWWWKPTTRRRDLIKAGALIVAEIERLDRLPTPAPQSDTGEA